MSIDAGVAAKSFRGDNGTVEHFIVLEATAGDSFEKQLWEIEDRYAAELRGLDLPEESAIYRRIFLSDILNQQAAVMASDLAAQVPGNPVAVSLIQQRPLSGAKIALLAYHVTSPGPITKRPLSPRHMLVEKAGLRHLWSTGLCADAASPAMQVDAQTRSLFQDLIDALKREGGVLRDHCVRTWLYVAGIDTFYKEMARSRRELFHEQGLTTDTHYLASTGIEGSGANPFDIVTMDSYSVLGLQKAQVSYLDDLEYMCKTKDYNVTFERGTRVAYADRAHVFLSGTASIDKTGQVLHLGDVKSQVERAILNGEAIFKAGGASFDDLTHLLVYVRDPSDYERVRSAFRERFPGIPILIVHASVCRPLWLFEFEGIAIAANDDLSLPSF